MADLSDVSAALGQMASLALYGPGTPSGNSLAGLPVLIQTGWPDPNSLQAQIAAKAAQVTVYPQPTERNVTRYQQVWEQTGPLQPSTFTLTVLGQVITVGGAQPSTFYGQNLAIFVNGVPYIQRTVSADNPTTIAAELAAQITGATSSGPAITIPNGARIGALRVGTQAPVGLELKRQERDFSIIVWAPSTASRDAIAKFIDVAIPMNKFLTLVDGSFARLIYKGSPYSDFDQKQSIYRRDFSVSVEYATLATDTAPEVIAIRTDYQLNDQPQLLVTEDEADIETEDGEQFATIGPDLTIYT